MFRNYVISCHYAYTDNLISLQKTSNSPVNIPPRELNSNNQNDKNINPLSANPTAAIVKIQLVLNTK